MRTSAPATSGTSAPDTSGTAAPTPSGTSAVTTALFVQAGAFSDPASKRQVSELLNQNQLDESAIEAEGISNSFEKLERITRLLTTLESRRHRALRQIFEYRNGFAQRLRDTSDRIIEGKAVAVDDNAGKSR